TRPPQPAWLGVADGAVEVELVDGEEGVAPGQACVFYDAGAGQARVLGGGFIKSVVASAEMVAARAPQRARAAGAPLRGLRRESPWPPAACADGWTWSVILPPMTMRRLRYEEVGR